MFALDENDLFAAFQLNDRCDVSDSTMQADLIVMLDVAMDYTLSIVQGERRFGPNTFLFQRAVPALNLAIALRVRGRRAHMRHATDTDKFFEGFGDELWTIVGDNPWAGLRELFTGSLENNFDILFFHAFSDFPVHDKAAVAIQD